MRSTAARTHRSRRRDTKSIHTRLAECDGEAARPGLGNGHHLQSDGAGFVYLAAVADWFCRKVLPWQLSITLSADFCIEALEDALGRYGRPEIFNTDQGSQFTSVEFIKVLRAAEIAISMDGKGSA